MDIFKKTNLLLDNESNMQEIDKLFKKYQLKMPLSFKDLFLFDNDDLKTLISFCESEDNLFDAIVANLTVIKMYNNNSNNEFMKKRGQDAVKYIDNFLINFNSYFNRIDKGNDELKKKYKNIITKDGINELVVNLDEVDDLIDSLNLNFREKGILKQEIGKSNVRKANINSLSDEDKELLLEADNILLMEQSLLNKVNNDNDKSEIDNNSLESKLVVILLALDAEANKARINSFNQNMHKQSIKLLKEYIDSYKKLKELMISN